MSDVVTVEVDHALSVSIEEGDESAFLVEIIHNGTHVTQYGTNADPWRPSGRTMLGNVIARRLDGYDRDEARRQVTRAFEEHEPALKETFE